MENYVVFEVKVATEDVETMDEAVKIACETLMPIDGIHSVTTNFSRIEDARGNWKWID